MTDIIKWTMEDMIEVRLKEDDDFLKVKETLTRIGIASRREKKLYQSCHILHKQGKYYIVHFKELFALDGKPTNLSENDIERRNTVVNLLHEWDLQAKYSIGNVGMRTTNESSSATEINDDVFK